MKIYFLFIIFIFSRCPHGTMSDDPRFLRLSLFAGEQAQVLYTHNLMRSRVYAGYETRGSEGPQPAAKVINYNSLKWDKNLENQAEDWVQQCYRSNDFKKLSGANFGQNVIKADFREPAPYDWAIQQLENLILTWYNEVEMFNGSDVSKFNPNTSQLSLNYTQMIWGATTRIGCSAIRFREVETLTPQIFFACNYSPKGNIENQPVYVIKA